MTLKIGQIQPNRTLNAMTDLGDEVAHDFVARLFAQFSLRRGA
jgi:hypothetical protein